MTYEVVQELAPLEFKRYFDIAKGQLIADVAVAAVPLPDGSQGHLMLDRDKDGQFTVRVVPDTMSKSLLGPRKSTDPRRPR